LSPGSRYGLIALSAAFSITMIMTGVANTGGNAESLNRLARCSDRTSSENRPLAPTGISFMRPPHRLPAIRTSARTGPEWEDAQEMTRREQVKEGSADRPPRSVALDERHRCRVSPPATDGSVLERRVWSCPAG